MTWSQVRVVTEACLPVRFHTCDYARGCCTDDPSSAKHFHNSGSYSSHQPNPYEILLRSFPLLLVELNCLLE